MRGQQGKLKEIVAMKQNTIRFYLMMMHGLEHLVKQELEQVRSKEFRMILMFIFQLCKINNIGAFVALIKTLLII
jgi:hypothetical protein